MTRITRRMIEEIHHKNNTIIDITDIIQEYRESIKKEQERVWRMRTEKVPSSRPTRQIPTREEELMNSMNALVKNTLLLIEDRGHIQQ